LLKYILLHYTDFHPEWFSKPQMRIDFPLEVTQAQDKFTNWYNKSDNKVFMEFLQAW
jgi:hypothetical protein